MAIFNLVFTTVVLLHAFAFGEPAPEPTAAAKLEERQAINSVCGYFDDNDFNQYRITCAGGNKCVVASRLTPAVGFCSTSSVLIPLTSLYDYTETPATISAGESKCQASRPYAGLFDFNDGATVFLGCDVVPFSYTAYFGANAALTPITDTVLATGSVAISLSSKASNAASQTGSVPLNTGAAFASSSAASSASASAGGSNVVGQGLGGSSAQAASPTQAPAGSNGGNGVQTSPSATAKGNSGSRDAAWALGAVLAAVIPLLLVKSYM